MENGKDCSILCGIEKLVGMPAGREWPRFALPIANHAASDQVGIIEDCAICMDQRIAQFSAFVNRAGSLGGGMTGYPARKCEVFEEASQAFFTLFNVRKEFCIGALQIGIGDHARPAVSGSTNINHIQVIFFNRSIAMNIDEV